MVQAVVPSEDISSPVGALTILYAVVGKAWARLLRTPCVGTECPIGHRHETVGKTAALNERIPLPGPFALCHLSLGRGA